MFGICHSLIMWQKQKSPLHNKDYLREFDEFARETPSSCSPCPESCVLIQLSETQKRVDLADVKMQRYNKLSWFSFHLCLLFQIHIQIVSFMNKPDQPIHVSHLNSSVAFQPLLPTIPNSLSQHSEIIGSQPRIQIGWKDLKY